MCNETDLRAASHHPLCGSVDVVGARRRRSGTSCAAVRRAEWRGPCVVVVVRAAPTYHRRRPTLCAAVCWRIVGAGAVLEHHGVGVRPTLATPMSGVPPARTPPGCGRAEQKFLGAACQSPLSLFPLSRSRCVQTALSVWSTPRVPSRSWRRLLTRSFLLPGFLLLIRLAHSYRGISV